MAKKGDVQFIITGDATDLEKKFKSAAAMATSTGKKIGAALAVGTAAAAAGTLALTKVMADNIKLANVQEQAEAKLEAVLRATGEAAGFNAEQLKTMASGLQSVTTVGDEVIINAQAMLATFKEIKGKAFEEATMAALDMSAALDQDLKSSIIQVGKALNDPIKGLTALSRVGVSFTEQQKEQIKVLQESGDILGAQKVILQELQSEFGGVARKQRETFGGMQTAVSNAFGDLREQLGFSITKNKDYIELLQRTEGLFVSWGEAVARGREKTDGLNGSLDDLFKMLDEKGGEFFESLPGKIDNAVGGIGDAIGKMGELKDSISGAYNALPSWIWEVGIVAALIGGTKGRVAIGAITGLGILVDKINEFNPPEWIEQVQRFQEEQRDAPEVRLLSSPETEIRIMEEWGGQLERVTGDTEDFIVTQEKAAGVIEKAGAETEKTAEKTKKLSDYTAKAADAWAKYNGVANGDMWLDFALGMDAANKSAEEHLQVLSDIDALVTDDAFYDIAATIEAETEEATDAATVLWEDFVSETGDIIHGFVSDVVKGEFDSIEDLFGGMLDSMMDMLLSFIARAAANSIIEAIFGNGSAGSGAITLGSLLSSSSSGSGGSGGGIGSLGTLSTAGKWIAGKLGIGTSAGSGTAAAGGTAAATGAGMSVYGYGSGAGSLGYTGAGGYVGGSVAEGGGLAAGSSGVGGSAAGGGGMAAGIGTAAAYTGYAAVAAFYLRALTYGDKPGAHDRLNEQLAANGMSGAGLVGMYSGGLHEISDPVKESLHSLREFESAMGDMNTGILTLVRSAEESGTAINVHAMALNENTGLFYSLGGVMNNLESNIANVAAGTGTLTTQYIEQMAAAYGLESSTAALIQKFLGAGAAAEYLNQGATQVQQAVDGVSVAFSRFASSATAAGDRIARAGGLLAQRGATFSLPQYAVGTDYVPRTGPAIIHQGEAIIPASENNGSRGVPDRALSVNIGGQNMANLILSVVDGHIEAREARGVTGRVYR